MHNLTKYCLALIVSGLFTPNLFAGQAVIAVSHADEGWSHYANGWQIFTPTGEQLGVRVLAHPHVKEQPFTRSIRNIKIPPSIDSVYLKAQDSVHGESDRKYVIKLKFEKY